jgi:hypothetical protein
MPLNLQSCLTANHKGIIKKLIISAALATSLTACSTPPPNNAHNLCKVFRQYPSWFWAAQKVQKKYKVPISVQMSIIYQESSFRSHAKPPRRKLFGFIPWTRPTSAYGYAQVVDPTWKHYQRATGRYDADRHHFDDAINFIGWYSTQVKRRAKVSPSNPKALYLAYHEGIGGYMRGTYKRKPWLVKISNNVARKSWVYHKQLMGCMNSLPKKPWWHLW